MQVNEDLAKIVVAYFDSKTEELEDQIERVSEQINALHEQRDTILRTLGVKLKVQQPSKPAPPVPESEVLTTIRAEIAKTDEFTRPQIMVAAAQARPDLGINCSRTWDALYKLLSRKEIVRVNGGGRHKGTAVFRRTNP